MHYFHTPSDIVVKDRLTGKTEALSFLRYAELIWFNDARWETPKTNLLRLVKVIAELEKKPGELAQLEDADWTILKTIIDQPAMGQNGPNLLVPLVQIQVGPTFEGAILDASTEDPRVPAADVAANGASKMQQGMSKSAISAEERT